MTCSKCKDRGWVFKDILMGLTAPCVCKEIPITAVTIDASQIISVASGMIIGGTISADQIVPGGNISGAAIKIVWEDN